MLHVAPFCCWNTRGIQFTPKKSCCEIVLASHSRVVFVRAISDAMCIHDSEGFNYTSWMTENVPAEAIRRCRTVCVCVSIFCQDRRQASHVREILIVFWWC